jgi:hypothetical protein
VHAGVDASGQQDAVPVGEHLAEGAAKPDQVDRVLAELAAAGDQPGFQSDAALW